MVGVDVGVARFATLSDGTVFEPCNSFKRHQQRLARYQRAMSRKLKFSNNWKKAKARVQKLHQKIGNSRRDYLHKSTTTISQNHAIVCIEDLQVRNMSKSAAGMVDQPGRNVRAKSGLNRSILDQGWFEFRRQLEYKQAWRGGWLIAVPPPHTSQECPVCHHTEAGNRRTQAHFRCVVCDFEENADLVGAINIRNRGLKWIEGQDSADASAHRATTPWVRIACEVNGAARPSAAGTHRSDYERVRSCVAP
jgi:putative transposase